MYVMYVMYVCMHGCMYVCMYACMYVCMYVLYTIIYTHNFVSWHCSFWCSFSQINAWFIITVGRRCIFVTTLAWHTGREHALFIMQSSTLAYYIFLTIVLLSILKPFILYSRCCKLYPTPGLDAQLRFHSKYQYGATFLGTHCRCYLVIPPLAGW